MNEVNLVSHEKISGTKSRQIRFQGSLIWQLACYWVLSKTQVMS